MCMFSGPVEIVADTNIFARSTNGRQFLVYGMSYAASADLAMVLPLPVPPNPPEDAVRFINLERYPKFFEDLRGGFSTLSLSRALATLSAGDPKLRVHDVGAFDASFVPRIDDFRRLDERFRIPPDVWRQLAGVSRLRVRRFQAQGEPGRDGLPASDGDFSAAPRRTARGNRRASVHPMAFTFPRRNPELLYFPTVHVHDREVHAEASFDHSLYCQPDPAIDDHLQGWERSLQPVSVFVDIGRSEGIVNPNQCCWRRQLMGKRQNKDALLGKDGALPELVAV